MKYIEHLINIVFNVAYLKLKQLEKPIWLQLA